MIERVVGGVMVVIDAAPAVARQAGRVPARHGEPRLQDENQVSYWTNGNAHGVLGATAMFEAGASRLESVGRGRLVAVPVRRGELGANAYPARQVLRIAGKILLAPAKDGSLRCT